MASVEQARLAAVLGASYTIVRPLGQGGMARVYLARDLKHDRDVAIKVLSPALYTRSFAERFLAEIAVTAGLQHPHILPLFDSGVADELLYYVMPYVKGGTLRDRLRATPQLPIVEAVRLATEIAGALEHAHQQGIVHRDIKPENILLQDGSALVADFGIAFSIADAAGDRLTGTGLAIGTPAYMSPEQASGERVLDARTDVYALGAVLYEMLAGVTPHTGNSAGQLLARVLTTDPEPLPTKRAEVSRPLAAVIAKALARRADARWGSAAAFASALASPPPVMAEAPAVARRTWWLRGAMAASVLAAAGGAAWWQWGRVSPPPVVTSRRQVTFVGTVQNVSLTPDGKTLAYVAAGDDTLSVYSQDLSGGRAIRLAKFANADIATVNWSPDGTRLLLTGVSGTKPFAQIIPALGGAVKELPATSILRDPVPLPFADWLPDGNRVLLWGPGPAATLHTIDVVGGGTSSRSVDGLGLLFGGRVSRDSDRLLVATDAPDVNLAIVPPSGARSIVHATRSTAYVLAMPHWGPGDAAVYALRNAEELVRTPLRRDGATAAAAAEVVATDLEAWVSRLHPLIAALSVSADATRAAFTRATRYASIETIGATEGPTALPTNTAEKWSATPSPDGTQIAYLQYTGGDYVDLWIYDVSSGSSRQITFDVAMVPKDNVPLLAWSPDGDRLAGLVVDKGTVRLAVLDPTGRAAIRILEETTPNGASGISWAPTPAIVYEDLRYGAGIHLLNLGRGRDSTILAGDTTVSRYSALLSRSGASVTYYQTATDSSRRGLYVAARDALPRRISPRWLTPIGWSEDERTIVVWEGGTRNILGVSLDGRTRRLAQTSRRNDLCQLPGARGLRGFVCTSIASVSDAWVLELKHSSR